jgi:hypothetical protein
MRQPSFSCSVCPFAERSQYADPFTTVKFLRRSVRWDGTIRRANIHHTFCYGTKSLISPNDSEELASLKSLICQVTKISTRARTFESSKLKVNDKDGNPIEIAAIITWKVSDTAQATFAVEHYVQYVHVQTEAALRDLAMHYSYDAVSDSPDVVSLRGSADHVSARLEEEVQKRLRMAGVELLSARISHLAYAPEIAQAMLQRQQAGAIIGARRQV